MGARETWDVFCRVVDNYGDIGIAWRLARQLVAEQRAVRLFVDDLESFARIEPRVRKRTTIAGVDIRRWPTSNEIEAAAVVVEMLGCGLPAAYLDAMVGTPIAPTTAVWIDFEHLSAESWVDGFHGLPSPHPVRPLTKHFFYPGFGDRTGGLLVEPGVDERRRAFVDDPLAVRAFRQRLGLDPTARQATLFAYSDAPVGGLLDAFAQDGNAWSVALPESVLTERVDAWFGAASPVGGTRSRGTLSVTLVPFVEQDDFDRLLWTSDVNIVRGEDSFVRAQIAGRPFLWQSYRQAQDAHRIKREAFETRYLRDADAGTRRVHQAFSNAWDDPRADVASVARAWLGCRAGLAIAAEQWRSQIIAAEPLIDRLVAFVAARRQVP